MSFSDTVWECGHACHLMDGISAIEAAPQVHMHFLTPDEEVDARLEFCCHGCGASLTVRYWSNAKRVGRHLGIKAAFIKQHVICQNRGYERYCPDWRTSFRILDLRSKKKSTFNVHPGPSTDIALLQSVGPAQSKDGYAEEGSRRRG